MKKSLLCAFIPVMLLAAGCAKEHGSGNVGQTGQQEVVITVNAAKSDLASWQPKAAAETKTMLNSTGTGALWEQSGESIIFLNAHTMVGGEYTQACVRSSLSSTVSSDGRTASFSATFVTYGNDKLYSNVPGDNKLYFLYPERYTTHTATPELLTGFVVDAVQHPTLGSFDGHADVLVGEPQVVEGSFTTPTAPLDVAFYRKSSALRIRLAGLDEEMLSASVKKVTFEAEVASEQGERRHSLAGDELKVQINPDAQGDAVYDIYHDSECTWTNTLVADYSDVEGYEDLPSITLGDLCSAGGTDGIWFSMLPQTITAFTLTVDLGEQGEIRFAKRTGTNMEIGSGYIKTMSLTYSEAKGDEADFVGIPVTWKISSLGAFTMDVDVDINEKYATKAFATLYPYMSCLDKNENFDPAMIESSAIRDANDTEKAGEGSFQTLYFTESDMTYTERTLYKGTKPSDSSCKGVQMHRCVKDISQSNGSVTYYPHDYVLVVGAKVKGEWKIYHETVDLPRPSFSGKSSAKVEMSDIGKTSATATISCTGATKVVYACVESTSDIDTGGDFSLGMCPEAYAGPITVNYTNLRKNTSAMICVIPFDADGCIGDVLFHSFTTEGDALGTATITSADFEDQTFRNWIHGNMTLSSDAKEVRIMWVYADDLASTNVSYELNRNEGEGARVYTTYTVDSDSDIDDFQFAMEIAPWVDAESNSQPTPEWGHNVCVFGAAVDASGNVGPVCQLHTLSGKSGGIPTITTEPTVRWKKTPTTIQKNWEEPLKTKLEMNIGVANSCQMILFMQDIASFVSCGNHNADIKSLMTAEAYEDYRLEYTPDFYSGHVYDGEYCYYHITRNVASEQSYVMLASFLDIETGEYTEPQSIVPSEYSSTTYNGTSVQCGYYKAHFEVTDMTWAGEAATVKSVTYNTSWSKVEVAVERTSDVKYGFALYVSTQSLDGDALYNAVKGMFDEVNKQERTSPSSELNCSSLGLGNVDYYRYSVLPGYGSTATISSFSKYLGRTMVIVYVDKNDNYNINCYIKLTEGNTNLIYFNK